LLDERGAVLGIVGGEGAEAGSAVGVGRALISCEDEGCEEKK